jgi:hypothetical protein
VSHLQFLRKKLKKQYPKIKTPIAHKVKMTDELKEQFHPIWYITKEKDNSAVLICNHY